MTTPEMPTPNVHALQPGESLVWLEQWNQYCGGTAPRPEDRGPFIPMGDVAVVPAAVGADNVLTPDLSRLVQTRTNTPVILPPSERYLVRFGKSGAWMVGAFRGPVLVAQIPGTKCTKGGLP